jgi:crotonobetainyl-CoA:carnitine CoA-transferase CaiB-like acyl-CoA transferase
MSGSVRRGARPLDGVRVLDLSRMIAGGVAGMLLADFGADVVKAEQPGSGDPLRQWTADGQPFWWKVYARNKRYITLNLKSDAGRELLAQLIPKFDIVLESFVPGTLERLGLGWDVLRGWNPALVLVRISGWGQTGPASDRPGFGTLVEAASGFAAMNGEPDGAPIVPAFPLADMTSALYAVNAAMFALYHRDVHGGGGQVIDVSLFESLFSLLGPLPAEYHALGRLRERIGSRSKNAGPRGCYRTNDGRYVAVSGSTPKMAERFLLAYQLDHLLQDERFSTNEARVRNSVALDADIASAIASRTLEENLRIVNDHALTAIAVQTVADIELDEHWRARKLLVDVPNGAGTVRMHNVVPRMSETPGEIRGAGGALGADNDAIYGDELGLSGEQREHLRRDGII